MKRDLTNEIEEEIEFFQSRLKRNDWKQHDYWVVEKELIKGVTPFTISLYPKLLLYEDADNVELSEIWVKCTTLVFDKYNKKEICQLILEELATIGFLPFKDEDAFMGYFAKEDLDTAWNLSCFINKDYPRGHWMNHVIS